MLGDPLAVLPILNFALLKYSRHVAAFIMGKGIQVLLTTSTAVCFHFLNLQCKW